MHMASRIAGIALFIAAGPLAAAAQAPSALGVQGSGPPQVAQATPKAAAKAAPAARQTLSDQQQKDRINSWTVGLAAGRIEGAPLQFASELARVLDDGDNMRVLPIVTRWPFDNLAGL